MSAAQLLALRRVQLGPDAGVNFADVSEWMALGESTAEQALSQLVDAEALVETRTGSRRYFTIAPDVDRHASVVALLEDLAPADLPTVPETEIARRVLLDDRFINGVRDAALKPGPSKISRSAVREVVSATLRRLEEGAS